MELIGENKCFGGRQLRFQHSSQVLNCEMKFSLFLPAEAELGKVPVLYWLSGLTCTDENFVIKAGAQRYAAKHGIALVMPDTSPRGEGVPDDEQGAYDFGLGAGFYVNATEPPWAAHYRMYDYVVAELPALINKQFPIDGDRVGISGHSMGGHGALTIAFKNPQTYKCVSAFAPICSPIRCSWGQKALGNYIGNNQEDWRQYDAIELIKIATKKLPVLVDQGSADDFLQQQLNTDLLLQASTAVNYPVTLRIQAGYDHSYFFIASFIEEHIAFHARYL